MKSLFKMLILFALIVVGHNVTSQTYEIVKSNTKTVGEIHVSPDIVKLILENKYATAVTTYTVDTYTKGDFGIVIETVDGSSITVVPYKKNSRSKYDYRITIIGIENSERIYYVKQLN